MSATAAYIQKYKTYPNSNNFSTNVGAMEKIKAAFFYWYMAYKQIFQFYTIITLVSYVY